MLLVLFLHPPHSFFTGWRPLTPDRRPAIMTFVLIVLFLSLLSIRPVTAYFGMIEAPPWVWGILGIFLLVWLLGFRLLLRRRWFDKLLLPT